MLLQEKLQEEANVIARKLQEEGQCYLQEEGHFGILLHFVKVIQYDIFDKIIVNIE